ncbi:hypothetical protein [Hydrogenophilus thiooxidans]|uniref:hypothetical protein n=1 Tax=Hydrogenophilus thiooxidans TaxID=2820326 RepID=UPI001C248DB1|nr:hypothetical protein [Hydrogenophilus thiooxidans]
MGFIDWFYYLFNISNINNSNIKTVEDDMIDSNQDFWHNNQINPASGLPMVGGVDIEGNPYGTDSSSMYDCLDSSSRIDDLFDNNDIFNDR